MQEIWFVGAKSDKERDSVKQDVALAFNAFRRLSKMLEDKLKEETSHKDYTVANWSHLQADTNGYNRALKEILKTIKVN